MCTSVSFKCNYGVSVCVSVMGNSVLVGIVAVFEPIHVSLRRSDDDTQHAHKDITCARGFNDCVIGHVMPLCSTRVLWVWCLKRECAYKCAFFPPNWGRIMKGLVHFGQIASTLYISSTTL